MRGSRSRITAVRRERTPHHSPPKKVVRPTWVMERVTVRNDAAVWVVTLLLPLKVISLGVVADGAGLSATSFLHHRHHFEVLSGQDASSHACWGFQEGSQVGRASPTTHPPDPGVI